MKKVIIVTNEKVIREYRELKFDDHAFNEMLSDLKFYCWHLDEIISTGCREISRGEWEFYYAYLQLKNLDFNTICDIINGRQRSKYPITNKEGEKIGNLYDFLIEHLEFQVSYTEPVDEDAEYNYTECYSKLVK